MGKPTHYATEEEIYKVHKIWNLSKGESYIYQLQLMMGVEWLQCHSGPAHSCTDNTVEKNKTILRNKFSWHVN